MNEEERAEAAHNLKTPVAVISGYAELLGRRSDDETRLAAAEQIGAAARRLIVQIDELFGIERYAPLAIPPVPDSQRRRARPARVMVIDDDVFVRRLLRMTLPAEDFEIAEAADGHIALSIADIQQPDLVLLDWRMPTVSGETVLADLKQRDPVPAVIVITAEADQRDRAEELGADAFLTKPFSPLELLRTVERLLPA